MKLTYKVQSPYGYVELAKLSNFSPERDAVQMYGNVYTFDVGVAVAFRGKLGSYLAAFRSAEEAADTLRRWYGPNYERYLLGSRRLYIRDTILSRDDARVGNAIRPPYEVVNVDGKDFHLVPHNGVDGDYILREVQRGA